MESTPKQVEFVKTISKPISLMAEEDVEKENVLTQEPLQQQNQLQLVGHNEKFKNLLISVIWWPMHL